MTATIQAKNLSLYDLEQRFNLSLTPESTPFVSWLQASPLITEVEQQALTRIQGNYSNQIRYLPMSEDLVKMIVLSPLLDLAGLYGKQFRLLTEEAVEIVLEDQDETIKGRIDILIVQEQFWILAIEAKRVQLDVMAALPQLLFYLLNNPNLQEPAFGMITNGREFVFVQLIKTASPVAAQYSCSEVLSINREPEFQMVLRFLRQVAMLLPQTKPFPWRGE